MRSTFDYYNPYSNVVVSNHYTRIVCNALTNVYGEQHSIKKIRYKKSNGTIFVVAVSDAIKAKLANYNNIVLWVQGIIPEESYMRNNSKFRMLCLSWIEKCGLRCANKVLFVSESMRNHYRQKYNLQFGDDKSYVMPCFNNEPNRESLSRKTTNGNVFLYAGGVQEWQCIDETLRLYKAIESCISDASLLLLTKDKKKITQKAEEFGIKRYEVDYTDNSEISKRIEKVKFGFVLRTTNSVNYVSTPTKLSLYIANGIIPIYTNAIGDFSKRAENAEYFVEMDINDAVLPVKLLKLCSGQVNYSVLATEYMKKFGNYYNSSYHQRAIEGFLQQC